MNIVIVAILGGCVCLLWFVISLVIGFALVRAAKQKPPSPQKRMEG
jgi:hypothetical protein